MNSFAYRDYLVLNLIKNGLWNKDMKNKLIAHNGSSVANIEEIPADLRALYKTVWEIKIQDQITMCADRGAFVDQSQSFNVHMTDINFGKLTNMHFYGWKRGLKTGMYYLRSKAAADAIKFTIDGKVLRAAATEQKEVPTPIAMPKTPESKESPVLNPAPSPATAIACSLANKDDCISCGS